MFPIIAARMMVTQGYLKETNVQHGFGSTVDLSKKGSQWLGKAKHTSTAKMMVLPNSELLHEEKSSQKLRSSDLVISAGAGPGVTPAGPAK